MDELEALSREVAAASDAWMMAGIEAVRHVDGMRLRLLYKRESGAWAGITSDCAFSAIWSVPSWGPNLHDDVTVNALLGKMGTIVQISLFGFLSIIDNGSAKVDGRIPAITRAWIAAHGKEKAHG